MFKHAARIVLALALAAIAAPCAFATAHADAPSGSAKRTVRVAYPVQDGLTDWDEYGERCGYTFEYLEEIAQYTGWDYEFIDTPDGSDESLVALMDMVRSGEADLIGGMLYSPELGKNYDYSAQNYGVVETVLQVPLDEAQPFAADSQTEQELVVAVLGKPGSRTIGEFESYCATNLVTPTYVFCADKEKQLAAVREGRADALLNTSLNHIEGVRTIASFSPKPFYFATTKGSGSGIMAELDAALLNIVQANPYFSTTLNEKYFTSGRGELAFTDEEREAIRQAGVLTVGITDKEAPLQHVGDDGGVAGISVDLLEYAAEKTGLEFEYVAASTRDELFAWAREGKVDLLAAVAYDYKQADEQGFGMTQPYLSAPYVLMLSKGVPESQLAGHRLALLSTSIYRDENFLGTVVDFDTVDECVRAVADGRVDYTYMNAYVAQYYANLPEFDDLKLVTQTFEPNEVSFGIADGVDRTLLGVLNKVIATTPVEDMQAVIYRNTLREPSFSLLAFIEEYSVQLLAAGFALACAVVASLVFVFSRKARRAKRTALELEKRRLVIALADEYFFEYDFPAKRFTVYPPMGGGEGPVRSQEHDWSAPTGDAGTDAMRADYLRALSSKKGDLQEVLSRYGGEEHWTRVVSETVWDGERAVYAIGKIIPIDDERREREELRERADRDSLTSVHNAASCKRLVQEALADLAEGSHGALLLIDVDRFKEVNDTYGHLRGDEALKRIAGVLEEECGGLGFVGRPGGDEFLAYVRDAEDAAEVEALCASLCERVRAVRLEGLGGLTVSIGAALSSPGDAYDELYVRVDRALYEAKAAGRDDYRIVEHPPSGASS